MDICNATEVGLIYDSPNLMYTELRDSEEFPLRSGIYDMSDKNSNSLLSAINRAKDGESRLYAYSKDENGNVVNKYIIDDLDAVLQYYGLIPSGHRHDLMWNYVSSDDGKLRYVDICLTMNCGCGICFANKRMLAKELREQFGIELVMSSINSMNVSNKETIKILRKSIRGKDHNLK